MLCRWISKSVPPIFPIPLSPSPPLNSPTCQKKKKRYEIESGTTGWEDAEKQVDRLIHLSGDKGKKNKKVEESGGVTVSVRSGKKRKGGGDGDVDDKGIVERIYNEEMGGVVKKVKKNRGKDKDMGKS